eukprot:5787177-Lingulodinium_polyedra.AAC.1
MTSPATSAGTPRLVRASCSSLHGTPLGPSASSLSTVSKALLRSRWRMAQDPRWALWRSIQPA